MNKELLDARSYLKGYLTERQLRYTKLDKHDKSLLILFDYLDDLETKLDEKEYEIKELKNKLQDKKEQCDNLIEHINPYHYYGLNENDYH